MLESLRRWLGWSRSPDAHAQPSAPQAASHGQPPVVDATQSAAALATEPSGERRTGPAARPLIKTWDCILHDAVPLGIASSDVDLVVVDAPREASRVREFTSAEVERMRHRPGHAPGAGRKKLVVAYLSVGEAESYRPYWRKEWERTSSRPSWLEPENPDWDENYRVHYWEPGWQRLLFGNRDASLDRMLAAGFDGVYLDIIDAFEHYAPSRPSARADMIALLVALSRYARRQRPDFLVIAHNGEALLDDAEFRDAISAVAKEDLYFGIEADEKPNSAAATSLALERLALATRNAIPVLVIEYLEDTSKIAQARRDIERHGFAACIASIEPAAA